MQKFVLLCLCILFVFSGVSAQSEEVDDGSRVRITEWYVFLQPLADPQTVAEELGFRYIGKVEDLNDTYIFHYIAPSTSQSTILESANRLKASPDVQMFDHRDTIEKPLTLADISELPLVNDTADIAFIRSSDVILVDGFEPILSNVGLLYPSDLGFTGEKTKWVITIRNGGNDDGDGVVLTNRFDPRLQVDRVELSRGNFTLEGQDLTVQIPVLSSNETITIQVYTTALVSGIAFENTVCMRAMNFPNMRCLTSPEMSALPVLILPSQIVNAEDE